MFDFCKISGPRQLKCEGSVSVMIGNNPNALLETKIKTHAYIYKEVTELLALLEEL